MTFFLRSTKINEETNNFNYTQSKPAIIVKKKGRSDLFLLTLNKLKMTTPNVP